jgi:hypothetical protein
MQNSSPIYLIFALLLGLISFVLIPRERYRAYFPVLLVATLIHAGLLYVTVNIIKAWQYAAAEPFALFGIPVFILLAWGFSLALFLWGLPERAPVWTHYLYILAFALAGTIIDATFHSVGLRPYSQWYSAWMWFFPLFFIFWITYVIYKKYEKIIKIYS